MSSAAPMAGTCEVKTEAVMRAMGLLGFVVGAALGLAVGLGVAVLAEDAVALGAAATGQHHGHVFLLAHAGHGRGHVLEALAVGRADLGQEVDVAAQRDAAVE